MMDKVLSGELSGMRTSLVSLPVRKYRRVIAITRALSSVSAAEVGCFGCSVRQLQAVQYVEWVIVILLFVCRH